MQVPVAGVCVLDIGETCIIIKKKKKKIVYSIRGAVTKQEQQ